MKKFEEELKRIIFNGVNKNNEKFYLASNLIKNFKDWISPEDHQAEVNKLKNKINWLHNLLDGRNEEVLQTVKQLNEAIPEIPEVSERFAEIYNRHKAQNHRLSEMLLELYTTSDLSEKSMTQGEIDDLLVSMLSNGYTVREKRFYLKHKSVLIFDPDSDDSDVEELYLGAGGNFVPYQHLAYKFTQQEIDSMETGSYEKIEVEE